MAFDILSDLKGVIDPSRLITLRLKMLMSFSILIDFEKFFF